MNIQTLTSATSAFLITLIYTIVISPNTNSQTTRSHFSPSPTLTTDSRNFNTTFFCGENEGVPATLARTSRRIDLIIRWEKKYYFETQEDPLTRCVRVSGIIHTYNQQGILNYIKIGKIKEKRAVCAINPVSNRCSRLVYTLKDDEKFDEIVLQVLGKVIERPSESKKIRSAVGRNYGGAGR